MWRPNDAEAAASGRVAKLRFRGLLNRDRHRIQETHKGTERKCRQKIEWRDSNDAIYQLKLARADFKVVSVGRLGALVATHAHVVEPWSKAWWWP